MAYYVVDNTDSIIDNSTLDNAALELTNSDVAVVTSTGYVIDTAPNGTAIYLDGYTSGAQLVVDGLVSGAEQGIYALGTKNQITVNGDVYGGISSEGSLAHISVGSGGYVSGNMGMTGQYSVFINDGTVDALIDGFQIDNSSSFTNNGLLSSNGFAFFFGGTDYVSIVNTGTIQGDFETYDKAPTTASVYIDNSGLWTGGNLNLSPGDDTVTNTGTITGDVNLGDGNNMLDSRNGRIDGSITAGSGNDTILCGAEDDIITGGAGGDTIDGGGGNNTVSYQNSAAGVYVDLTDGIAKRGDAAGDHLSHIQNITGSLNADTLIGDNGDNTLNGVTGNDTINGGNGNDTLIMEAKGNAHLNGGAGNDTIQLVSVDPADFGPAFSAADHIDGGTGFDTMILTGTANVVFGATTVVNVERIQMEGGYNYTLTTADATVAAGQTLQVDASALTGSHFLSFDGSAELDGTFIIDGGAGKDALIGGHGNDQIAGGGGADTLSGGGGSDMFVYNAVTDSTGPQYDTINNFNANADSFSFPVSVAHLDAAVTSGALSTASFNTNLHADLNGHLAAGDAILFDATSGTLAGHTFLVVDANGVAGYQANADYVIDITGYTGTLSVSDLG